MIREPNVGENKDTQRNVILGTRVKKWKLVKITHSTKLNTSVAQFLSKLLGSLQWNKFLMGAPPIHHIPTRVNDSLSQEIHSVEKGVMNSGPGDNPLKVSKPVQLVLLKIIKLNLFHF